MPEWMEKGKELNDLIRPHTFPLAIKLVKREEEIPQGARRPWRDLKVKIAICQGITLSRRYGWTVAMTEADTGCAFARVIYGWEADGTKMSDFLVKMGYAATHEAGVKIGEGMSKFRAKEYAGIVFSPLAWTKIAPDLIMVYGNPAQIMRLLHGATHHEGNNVVSAFSGRAGSCSGGIIQTMLTGECQVVVPGNGDRVWAMTQDEEVAFTIPAARLGLVIEGLKVTHERGVRYPIPICQRFQPEVKLGIPLSDVFL